MGWGSTLPSERGIVAMSWCKCSVYQSRTHLSLRAMGYPEHAKLEGADQKGGDHELGRTESS